MTNVRDLADELLTLQPVDPARCNPHRKAHPVIDGRELECSECWRERVIERLEQWRRDITSSRPGPPAPIHPEETKWSDPQPVGQLIDSLGVTSTIAPDDLPVAALVLLKVVDADGGVRLILAYSDGMDWITRLGMLTAATASETPDPSAWQDQEDHP